MEKIEMVVANEEISYQELEKTCINIFDSHSIYTLLLLYLTSREYKLATEYQNEYYKVFGKWVTLEELFKTALFIKQVRIKQNEVKPNKQTTLGGLI